MNVLAIGLAVIVVSCVGSLLIGRRLARIRRRETRALFDGASIRDQASVFTAPPAVTVDSLVEAMKELDRTRFDPRPVVLTPAEYLVLRQHFERSQADPFARTSPLLGVPVQIKPDDES